MLLLYSLSAWGLYGRHCHSRVIGLAHSSFSSCSTSISTYTSAAGMMRWRTFSTVLGKLPPHKIFVHHAELNNCVPSSLYTSLIRGWWRGSLWSSACCCCFFTTDLQYDCSSDTCWSKKCIARKLSIMDIPVATKSCNSEAYWELCTGMHTFPDKHWVFWSLWGFGHN